MIELDTRYKTGQRTFVYLIFRYAWWLIALGVGCLYLAGAMYVGHLHDGTVAFLAAHPDWYIDDGMISQWTMLVGLAFIFIGFLRVSVEYRKYSFYVDDHAFHLNRGLIRIQEITIPYQQISNVHIEQPYHWRLFGLAQLDITISSSRTALHRKKRDFLIPVIDKALARELSRFLVAQASGEEEEEDEDDFHDEDDSEDIEVEGHF